MHVLSIGERIVLAPGYVIDKGDYLAEDISACQMMVHADGGSMNKVHPEEIALRAFDPEQNWNGRKVLVQRTGGYGDLVLLTPVLRELNRRWPQLVIDVCCFNHFAAAIENLSFINTIRQYPVPILDARQYDAWVLLENVIEKNPAAHELHMTDLFADRCGIVAGEQYDRHPVYHITERERIWADVTYPRTKGVNRLGMQFNAKVENRTYPAQRMSGVAEHFVKAGWEVLVMGEPNTLSGFQETDRLRNLTAHNTTFRQSCAVINSCDAFVGPDSALVHIAGALDVPAVGLYGPFPSKLRTAYSPSIEPMDGRGHCAPCFHHVRRGQNFPKNSPCTSKGFCTVLDSIPVKKVCEKIESVARMAPVV